MTIHTLPERRREIILGRLATAHRVVARDLAEEFGVSEDAIRRDLRDLAEAGKCRRVYGGALPLADTAPFVERVDRDLPAKRSLARAGIALIQPNQTVYIDAGSTNLLLAESLPSGQPVTVVTNSIAIAASVYRRPEVRLFLVGGRVDPELDGALGAAALAQVSRYRPDLTFIGVCAASPGSGVAVLDDRDADLKREAIASSNRVVVMATNDKLARTAPCHVAPPEAVHTLIVEHDAPEAACAAFERVGSIVVRANRPPGVVTRDAGPAATG